MRYWLIVPAAGSGRRFGLNAAAKQYADIAGRSVLEWACHAFGADRRCQGAVFALRGDDPHWPAVRARLGALKIGPIIEAAGGSERAYSVRNALSALADRAQPQDLVLVHDAARPCLLREDLDALLRAAARHEHGALLAVPLADTLKRAATPLGGLVGVPVAATVSRELLWRALTPQAARYAALCAALDAAAAENRLPTDEAQALEWRAAPMQLVPGAASNIKITSADDLALARALIAARAHASVDTGAPGAH